MTNRVIEHHRIVRDLTRTPPTTTTTNLYITIAEPPCPRPLIRTEPKTWSVAWWFAVITSAIFWYALLSGLSHGQAFDPGPEPSAIAREEHAITMLRAAQQRTRWQTWNGANQPQVVFVQSLGAPAQAQAPPMQPIIIIVNQAPAPQFMPVPGAGNYGVPPMAGRVPEMYWATYWPFIQRMNP